MRILPVRSISGRIVLGFTVLVATFGGVLGYAIYEMSRLGSELRFIRAAYLEMSLRVVKMQSLQAGAVGYLDEPTPRRAPVERNREDRGRLLDEMNEQVTTLGGVSAAHAASIDKVRENVAFYRARFAEVSQLYDQAFGGAVDDAARKELLARAKRTELELVRRIKRWGTELREVIDDATRRLELAEEQARLGALVLGAIAVFVGLLITIGAVLTLRPLRQLRAGVERVAGGDHAQRVHVDGENQLALVAREFNVMAAAIQEREQELVRAARLAAIGKMASMITHEIRNPLSSIGLNAELLEEELRGVNGSQEGVELCRAIHSEVDRLTAITEEYLRFARMPKPRLEAADLNEVVTDVARFQREALAQLGVTVETDLAEGALLVDMDEAQIRQAIINLVRNGAEAMQPRSGGTLTLATRRTDGLHEVRIQDEGVGIPAEDRGRIFETFFSTKERGTGLGLALVQQIVAEHGGRVDVESTVGTGTTFILRLPVA